MDPCVCDFAENDCALIRYMKKSQKFFSCLAENYFTYLFCYFAIISYKYLDYLTRTCLLFCMIILKGLGLFPAGFLSIWTRVNLLELVLQSTKFMRKESVYFQQTMSFVFQSARASLSVQMVSEFRWSTRKVFEDPASSDGQLSNKI